MGPSIHVLWNPSAGAAEAARRFQRELARRPDVRLEEPGSEGEMRAAAARAARRGATRIVAAGGDGTANTVARGLLDAGLDATLHVLPLGTGNDLCRTLGVPLGPQAALEALDAGRTALLDVVRVTVGDVEGIALNMATGGMSAKVVQELDDDLKRRWGPRGYLRGALGHLRDLSVYDLTARLDGGAPERLAALNVVIGNGRTSGGGLDVAPRASPTDGLLDVVLVLDAGPLEALGIFRRLLAGDYLESERVVFRRARRVELDSMPPMPFTVDGNLLPPGPASFEVLPGALRVGVGAEFESEGGSGGASEAGSAAEPGEEGEASDPGEAPEEESEEG